jgi:hypothetical protein
MNNYQTLLLYLKSFEGDGKEHPIEHLFPESTIPQIKAILQELSDEALIKFSGRENRKFRAIVSENHLTGTFEAFSDPTNDFSPQKPFTAKITFKGSKYLKEEIQMQQSGKYNISISGQGNTNNFVIESKNVTISNSSEFSSKIERIIETLKNDSTISDAIKENAINDFQMANQEANSKGTLSENIFKKLCEYGSDISSIAQLVISLVPLVN